MTPYANVGGKSGVVWYQIHPDAITVGFKGNASYKYSYASAGESSIEHMKLLAASGQGLGTYINTVVKKLYEARLS